MPVIVTRPQAEADPWVARLRAHGMQALALPLIEIRPAPDESALARAREKLTGYDAVMFVSANAVRALLQGGLPGSVPWRAWAPGPGTAEALRSAGFPASGIDTPQAASHQFDSEALWRVVAPQASEGFRLLIVRGADDAGQPAGREWLREQAEAAGASVDTVAAYARARPSWGTAELDLARRSASDESVWLFSSSEAIANLLGLLPGQAWSRARAVATHPRIAQAARTAGFGVVRECRPSFEDVLASLQSAG